MKTATKEMVLVGAGLAGSLLALFLAKRGYKVKIFERRPDMRKEKISAGRSINLALAERGIFPLKQAGIFDQVEKLLIPMKGRMIHDLEGKLLFQKYGRLPHEMIYSVSRGLLTSLLMTEAEKAGDVEIFFNERVDGVNFERSEIHLTNEKTKQTRNFSFKSLIGTDGSASAIRIAMAEKGLSSCTEQISEHGYKELHIDAGPQGFQMEKNALHIWPRGGFMLIALPNLDGSFTVTLFYPTKGTGSFEELSSEESISNFFKKNFSDAFSLMPTLTKDFTTNPLGHLITVRTDRWYVEDKILLLGDAAHAIVPFHGQGMNCAFEDCLELANLIDEKNGDFAEIFPELEKRRKSNANAIADMALENYIEMRDSVRDPKFHLKKKLEFILEEKFENQFIPRYSMVMFHRLPYAEAKRRGEIQAQILDSLTAHVQEIDQVDMNLAADKIKALPVLG